MTHDDAFDYFCKEARYYGQERPENRYGMRVPCPGKGVLWAGDTPALFQKLLKAMNVEAQP